MSRIESRGTSRRAQQRERLRSESAEPRIHAGAEAAQRDASREDHRRAFVYDITTAFARDLRRLDLTRGYRYAPASRDSTGPLGPSPGTPQPPRHAERVFGVVNPRDHLPLPMPKSIRPPRRPRWVRRSTKRAPRAHLQQHPSASGFHVAVDASSYLSSGSAASRLTLARSSSRTPPRQPQRSPRRFPPASPRPRQRRHAVPRRWKRVPRTPNFSRMSSETSHVPLQKHARRVEDLRHRSHQRGLHHPPLVMALLL